MVDTICQLHDTLACATLPLFPSSANATRIPSRRAMRLGDAASTSRRDSTPRQVKESGGQKMVAQLRCTVHCFARLALLALALALEL